MHFFYFRGNDDEVCVMVCSLRLKHYLLAKSIPYKYVVFNPKTMADPQRRNWYEFLHNIPGKGGDFLNRCLFLGEREKREEGRGL